MMEEAPNKPFTQNVLEILMDEKYAADISKINESYLYWDKVKYLVPKELNAEVFWSAVKYSRRIQATLFQFDTCTLFLKETQYMQEKLHEFDMHFGGTLTSSGILSEKNHQYYLLSSIMEEAIASSQMEGASTTRRAAKEMLRKKAKPKDRSQQMILNNYNTIRFLSERKNDNLTPELILEIHKRITENTLDSPSDEGRFRSDNNIYVVNGMTGEVAHEPPSHEVIVNMINQLCRFANGNIPFIHPIIKAIILHFMISYLHPFIDGNGRTARSVFYWYMLKNDYWMTEYLSVSRVIYKSKVQYEKAFLYTEHDDFDLGYFVTYNMKVLRQAFDELKNYLERKSSENNALLEYGIPGLNERQIRILKICAEKPSYMFTCNEIETRFNVSVKTARSDLEGLVEKGLLDIIPLNRRLKGYAKSMNFESRLEEIRGKQR
ncbi:MAG: Fic family protein [Bullifex sp.]